MKITFLLPEPGHIPKGGFKIVYQYADGLVGLGHEVTVVHPSFLSPWPQGRRTKLRQHVLHYAYWGIKGSWRPNKWFQFRNPVRLTWVPALAPCFLPRSDAYVATWWLTAEKLASWQSLPGSRFYLLQSLETWGGPPDRVLATWRADLKKIVIAKWLQAVAQENNQPSVYIPNGLDFDRFGCDVPPADRRPASVAMLYHDLELKGSRDGIEALVAAKSRIPELTAELFGVSPAPAELPSWIRYHQTPSQIELRRLYNRAAIFVSPSWIEGWPLPPAEAMMSGAAVIATDIGGHREYCLPDDTSLLVPPKAPAELAEAIIRLANDSELRCRIAMRGHKYIQQFTWPRALKSFEQALSEGL